MNNESLVNFLGLGAQKINYKESIISGIGGFFGIAGVYFVSRYFISDDISALFIIASKSFNTLETLNNSLSARQWLLDAHCSTQQLQQHLRKTGRYDHH